MGILTYPRYFGPGFGECEDWILVFDRPA